MTRESEQTGPDSELAQNAGESDKGRHASPEGVPTASSPDPGAQTADQAVADAHAEVARIRDQLLRTAADFENFRKRSRREQEDAERRGREGMIRDLLPVFDNLERAIQHTDAAPDVKSVADGLRMVAKQFVDTLERIGVTRISSLGQPFDPANHEAVQNLPSAEAPAGVIIAELQSGYRMGNRLIRASSVVVSKGPAEAN